MSSTLKYTTKLSNQRILILGGSSGIGFCVAEAALEHGADVIITSSSSTKLDKTITRLRAAYPEQTAKQTIRTHACDLADTEHLDENIENLLQTATDGGTVKLNHVVFTAGDISRLPPLEEITPADTLSAGTVRFVGAVMLAKHLPKYMVSSPSSSLTLTSGVRAHKPAPGWAMASSWGAAIEGLMRGLAMDLKPLRVNLVEPGAVGTELFEQVPGDVLEGMLEVFRKSSLTGTVGRPEDVAEAYVYLMKDGFVTGSIVESNGGVMLAG